MFCESLQSDNIPNYQQYGNVDMEKNIILASSPGTVSIDAQQGVWVPNCFGVWTIQPVRMKIEHGPQTIYH